MTASMPLLSMLSQKMSWLSARQSVLAQNVANADTPGYSSRDIKAPDFAKMLANSSGGTTLSITNPLHIAVKPDDSGFEMVSAESSEGSPTGNSVSLEQEIMKLSDTQIQYQTATNLYRKAVNMFQIALGTKG